MSPPRRRLPKLFLEITSLCNLACDFCPPTLRQGEHMPAERFERVMAALEGRVELLFFHIKGEPLLHPRLGEFLAGAARHGFPVSLTTNGSLLESRTETLLEAPNLRKLSVSLHSQVGSGRLEEYWRGLESFLDAHRLRPRFPVSLRLWNRGEEGLPPETAELWERVSRRYGLGQDLAALSARPESLRLDTKVWLNQAERFAWPDPSLPETSARGSCRGLRDQVGVLVDGRVVPCCLDGEGIITLGNILETPLAEILASPRARAMREGFERGELAERLCRSCGYRERFPAT